MRTSTRSIGQVTEFVRLAALATALGATLQASAAHAEELDVIQYNVQFVAPWDFSRADPGHRPNTEERARAIGQALACFDIVALNETINDSRRAQILEAMELAAPGCGKAPRFEAGRHFEIFAGPRPAPAENRLGSLASLADFATSKVPLAAVDDGARSLRSPDARRAAPISGHHSTSGSATSPADIARSIWSR